MHRTTWQIFQNIRKHSDATLSRFQVKSTGSSHNRMPLNDIECYYLYRWLEMDPGSHCSQACQERAWYDAHREQILRGDDGPGEVRSTL